MILNGKKVMLVGLKGETGVKIVSTELIGQDENGGNIYQQTFDDGSTSTFTVPSSGGGSNITVDTELSSESENPVQNKVVTDELGKKLEKPETRLLTGDVDVLAYKGTQYGYRSATSTSSLKNTIALRDSSGVAHGNEPTTETGLTPKSYVDTVVATLNEALEDKLDKTTSTRSLYGTHISQSGVQAVYKLGTSEAASITNNIPIYVSNRFGDAQATGYLLTNSPVLPYQAANKLYVDEAVANAGGGSAMWLHRITIYYNDTAIIKTISFTAISSDATQCQTFEQLIQFVPKKIGDGSYLQEEWSDESGFYETTKSGRIITITTVNNGTKLNLYLEDGRVIDFSQAESNDYTTYSDTPVQI